MSSRVQSSNPREYTETMRNVRNNMVSAMNKRHTGSRPMKDRRDKRSNNPKRSWQEEE